MKILKFTALSLVVALTACQSDNIKNISSTNVSSHMSKSALFQELSMNEQHLSATWQLKDSSFKGDNNQPLTLKFEKGEVLVLNGCNNMRASYEIKDNHLMIGSPISTRMMCEPSLMALDNLATKLLKGKVILQKTTDNLSNNISLKIITHDENYQLIKVQ